MKPLEDLEKAYARLRREKSFREQLAFFLENYAGRPTPLYRTRNWSKESRTKIYLKREDLCHTGAHKINNTIGQALLAVRIGKKRLIAETGAGQHGVAAATAARLFGLSCDVYMGKKDVLRQALNVYRMELLGARVIPVCSGSQTLKDACNEAIRDWVTNVDDTHYLIGSTMGPHPYPMMVRDFQSVIGRETRRQILKAEGRLPDYLIACVGGGSNAMGFFHGFIGTKVKMIGVEAAGKGLGTHLHSAAIARGRVGVLHGMKSLVLEDNDGQVLEAHSVSAGLDYPSVGPEHALLSELGRVQYESATDGEALSAFHFLTRKEGIMPALESSHAIAYAMKFARGRGKGKLIAICLSGRGDKDIGIIQENAKTRGAVKS